MRVPTQRGSLRRTSLSLCFRVEPGGVADGLSRVENSVEGDVFCRLRPA